MGLKILHSADWHLDSPFASLPEEQRQYLRRKQLQLPDKIAELTQREGCHMVLLAGDIFDGIPGREWVDAVKAALKRCAVPVFISPGNHDHLGPGSPWESEVWPENVYIFRGGLEYVTLPQLDCRVYGAGYHSMDCPGLLQDFHAEGREKYCIALLHGDPTQSHSPCCPVTAAQIRESGLNYLALGHIHKADSCRSGDTLCGWPGCPMGRGWDETGEKGVYIVTLESSASIRFRSLGLPCFHAEQLHCGPDARLALEEVLPAAGSGDFYRVRLTGFSDGEELPLGQLRQRFPNLWLEDRREPMPDLWEEAGEDTLRGIYFGLLQTAARTDPQAELAARISWELLSGREVTLP